MTSSNSTPVLTTLDQSVRAVIAAVGAAWTAGDADAFAALYAPDATVVLPGGAYLKGRNDIRGYSAAGFAGPLKGSTTINSEEEIRRIGDDVAIAYTVGGIRMAGETEVAADRTRRATWVFSRRGESWLIDAYTTCPV